MLPGHIEEKYHTTVQFIVIVTVTMTLDFYYYYYYLFFCLLLQTQVLKLYFSIFFDHRLVDSLVNATEKIKEVYYRFTNRER